MAVCKYHRDRRGVGVCMRCRAVICADCCTRVDGINHCHACLKELGRPVEAGSLRPISTALAAACVLGLTWLFFASVLWLAQGRIAP